MFEQRTYKTYTALLGLKPDPATLELKVTLQDGYDKNSTTFVTDGPPQEFTIPAGFGAAILNSSVDDNLSAIGSPGQVSTKDLIMGLIFKALKETGQI